MNILNLFKLCCFVMIFIQVASTLDTSDMNGKNSTLSRQKRIEPLSILIAFIISASVSGSTVSLNEFYRASSSDECAFTIRYFDNNFTNKFNKKNGALDMNFMSTTDNNWNFEKLDAVQGLDKTKEKVDGGFLKLIQMYPQGKFCVQAIIFSCGSKLTYKGSERSIVLDVQTIRKAWFRQGNPRFLEVFWEKNCLWFSNLDFRSVRAIDVYPGAFTECENANEDCISRHIQVF
ncbi:unnamed protein product [Brachionus calyciflorus]|uniref:Uncharacterized protein n=1 Tax=Brachionus calyciflorus TaxID=104777 RepID=A0A814NY79_9BILA|nr:unnamed protein product [Brachionus calyciflorus]